MFWVGVRGGRVVVEGVGGSVMDTNTLNLDLDPGFWPNLDPDPGLCYQFWKKKLK